MVSTKSRFAWKRYFIALIALIVAATSPLIATFSAEGIAAANGCALSEGYAKTCVIIGIDWGGILHVLNVAAWWSIITLPAGVIGAMILPVVFVVHFGIHLFRNRSNRTDAP